MAAEKLIRDEFAAYMYAGGRGRVINRAEYLRWKFRDQEQVGCVKLQTIDIQKWSFISSWTSK